MEKFTVGSDVHTEERYRKLWVPRMYLI